MSTSKTLNTRLKPRFFSSQSATAVIAFLTLALSTGGVYAEKPEWAGQGKSSKQEQKEKGNRQGNDQGNDHGHQRGDQVADDVRVGGYFSDPQRVVIRDYYGNQFKAGRCPPGLAKKNNGCLPPGQAKKWMVGQPLPRDVTYYPVPQTVVIQLGLPPSGHKYVRVASDILLIAIGTGLIVDAVQDLGRL